MFNVMTRSKQALDNHDEGEKVWLAFKRVCRANGLLMYHCLAGIIKDWVLREDPKALKR